MNTLFVFSENNKVFIKKENKYSSVHFNWAPVFIQ